jgi:teichuronic acid biosynthesis glycosyltransferase TuaH
LVYCAGVGWDDVQGTDRNLVLRLADRVDVLWVDPPLSVVGPVRERRLAAALRARGPRSVAPGVARLTVVTPPFPERPGVRRVTSVIMRRAIRRAVRRTGRTPLAIVVSSPEPRVGALPDVPYVYFATDDFTAGGDLMGLDARRLAEAERAQIAGADLLVAVSARIVERWDTGGRPTVVLPNGCDAEHYRDVDTAERPPDVRLQGPVAGVVGQLSARLDLDLLDAVAAAGISLLLVGPLQDAFAPDRVARLLALPHVQWVGRQPYDRLRSYLRVIDVGLTPYADTPFNRASDPLKTLEYLAAGRPVVSTPLPSVERLRAPWIVTASDPASFATATAQLLAERRTDELVRARQAFADQHSWSARATQLLAAVRALDAGPARDDRPAVG